MKTLYCLINLSEETGDVPIDIVCCYFSYEEALHMEKENQIDNPDSTFTIISALLAEPGEVVPDILVSE